MSPEGGALCSRSWSKTAAGGIENDHRVCPDVIICRSVQTEHVAVDQAAFTRVARAEHRGGALEPPE